MFVTPPILGLSVCVWKAFTLVWVTECDDKSAIGDEKGNGQV